MSEYSKLTFTDGTLITAELMNQLSDNIEYALETPPSELNVNGKTPDETGKITLAATDVNALYLGDAGTGDAPSLNAGTLGGEKPQSPIMSGTDSIYPLTTADQVIKADGSRLEQNGKIVADDSAKLGGEPATTYALKADLDKKANKSIVSDTWQTGQTYEKGAYCIYNDGLYKALVQTTAEPASTNDWQKCIITNEINDKNIIAVHCQSDSTKETLISEITDRLRGNKGTYFVMGSWTQHSGGYSAIVNAGHYSPGVFMLTGTVYARDGTGFSFMRYEENGQINTKLYSFTMSN